MKRSAVVTTVLTFVLVLLLPFIGGGGPPIGSNVAAATSNKADVPIFASAALPAPRVAAATKSQPAGAVSIDAAAAQSAMNVTSDTEHLAQKPVPILATPAAPAASPGVASNVAAKVVATVVHGRVVRTVAHAATAGGQAAAPRNSAPAAAVAGPTCPGTGGGGGNAPGTADGRGATGTTTSDIQSFSAAYNAIRGANCLPAIPAGNFRYDSCMEQRLFWMGEDPSSDPGNTWGHTGVHSLAPAADGTYYSETNPSRGCDGNLAGGWGNSGATVAQKWWGSSQHRLALFKPSFTGTTAGVCIYFAMTHGGASESAGFTRAAARWGGC